MAALLFLVTAVAVAACCAYAAFTRAFRGAVVAGMFGVATCYGIAAVSIVGLDEAEPESFETTLEFAGWGFVMFGIILIVAAMRQRKVSQQPGQQTDGAS